MKIVKLETFIARVAYKHVETSSLINRGGITDVIVKLTTQNGLVGWGECTRAADTAGIESAVQAMAPLVIGRSILGQGGNPSRSCHLRRLGVPADDRQFRLCRASTWLSGTSAAKSAGQPLYRLLGGAMREAVDYFYYMEWGTPDEIAAQAKDGVRRGYRAYYIKAGVDERREEEMLEALRDTIGPQGKIRIDVNQAWTIPQAARLLKRWHHALRPRFRRGAGADRSGREHARPAAAGRRPLLRQ